ncbi:T9SS sorting signal type C domain-containing protein [Flavobacterium sp. HBTb2-11-1]|uniref:T9SS sorting signal type C domain-containing protein n=1 Tax=Flavobacterium sp. HBTb2-11-1 TaxID=2692212 RepID=UPI00136E50F2|nr:T9SS sorting signal type C domain-containing protein [Flavobacterium sp. HBTb2-11-1]MXO06314.1 T9SS sorting signal type C domain-containing protein [Flavobacterium sp. HBTb2-11-1]
MPSLGLLCIGMFFVFLNSASAQTATISTWPLTSDEKASVTGNVSASDVAIGSSLNSTSYSAGSGISTRGWSDDASSLQGTEYYEFKITPKTGFALNITDVNFEYSVSNNNGNWQVQAFYSTDNFATRTAISDAFSSNNTSPTSKNTAISIPAISSPITIRIYGWESDGNYRLRIRNFVVKGNTTCLLSPITTGVTICQGGSGALSATLSNATTTTTTFSGSWDAAVDLTANMLNGGMVIGDPCLFSSTVRRNYTAVNFTVNQTGSYTFKMTDDTNFDGMAYIYTGAFTPGSCAAGTWVVGADDDGQADREPRLIATLTAGTVYTLVSTTWATTSGTYSGNYTWTVIPPAGGQLTLSTVNWYTAATGGNPIWNGSIFNPAGVTGSGVASAPAPGTYTFYASSGGASCSRTPATFTVNATPTLTGVTQSASVCPGSAATINLSGLLANSTSTVSYTINGAAQTATSVVASSTGAASFTTPALTGANNGQTLQITGITTTSSTPNCNQSFTSSITLSVNPLPTTANAGADQYGNGAFTLVANVPTAGTGTWSITSGPSTSLTQFSNVNAANATFTPIGAGTYTLKWTITNSCGTSTDDVILSNCVGNLIKNGDFTYGKNDWSNATTKGSYVEVYNESVYFGNGNNEITAELDSQASLGQSVTVIPNVPYTLSFIYARRPGSSPTTGVDVKIIDGSNTTLKNYTTNDITNTPIFVSIPYTPSSSTIWIEFYNSVETTTLGSIIDNIVLLPSSQVNPVATTTPKGKYKTLDACDGTSVQLDVDNVTGSGLSYAWTSTSTGVTFSETNVKNPKITVTGTGTKNATVVVTQGGCSSVSSTTYINVLSLPVAGLTSSDADNTFCAGTPVTFTASGGTSYVFKVDSAIVQSGNSATYTTTALTNGQVVIVDVTNASGCTSTSTGITNTVNPKPTAPSISHTDVSCGSLGSITLTNLPAVNWKVYLNDQTGAHPYSRQNTETDLTINDLPIGRYDFTVENIASGCVSDVASVNIIDISSTTTWNGSVWSNGEPDGSKSVTISSVVPSQPFSAAKPNITVCSLTITAGSDVIIPSEMTLTVTNGITSNGKLTFESGSSLLQGPSALNTGTISYKRKVSMRRYDVVYWATPVTDVSLTMYKFSPNTLFDKYYYWNATTTKWVPSNYGGKVMEMGQGYSIRGPQYFDLVTPQIFEGVFVGVPNNGDVSFPVVANKLNLIGNPYPSPVDADELMLENKDKLGSLYFWTHNQPPQLAPGTNTFKYLSSDFVVYNGTGSVRVNNEIVTGADEFKGYIGAGQAFFAIPPGTEVKFKNEFRKGSSENTQFYKTAKKSKIEKNRLWLNIANSQGAFKQILIGYIEGATNAIDVDYDAVTMGSNSYIDFYTLNESKKLTVQGRGLPFDNTEIIPLGYKSGVDDKGDRNFTISIDHADGFFTTQPVYLEDKVTGKVIDLRKENYTFFTIAETNITRFALRYTNKTLGTGDFENIENAVLVSVKDKAINITSSKETIKEVNVYNIGAELLYSNSKVNASELQIKNLHSSDQVLLVKITLENGHAFTKKVVFSNL